MALIAGGEAPVDYIKAGAFGPFEKELKAMRAALPVLLHGLGSHERTGMPGFEAYDFARANRLLAECGSPHLAIHFCITNADAGPGWSWESIGRRMAACTRAFMKNLAMPLLLENIGDTPNERTTFDLLPVVEPEKIGGLIRETGASMLLDTAHAKITALYRNWDIKDYILAFPLSRVREIHVSGAGFDADGAPYDAHGPMEAEDYELLEWALGHTRPDIVTLEYGLAHGSMAEDGTEEDLLREQLLRLRGILQKQA